MKRLAGDRRLIKIAAGPCIGLLVAWLLGQAALSPEAMRLAGILVCTCWWWVSEALPLSIAGLLASCLCAVLSVGTPKQIMGPYGDPIIFLFMGSFWIAQAMSIHGLDRRLALRLLSVPWVNASPAGLVLGIGVLAAAISLWVSNTATTAMLLPIVLGIMQQMPGSARSEKLEQRLLLMLAFAASVGGLGTPVGTPPNLIGIGMLERLAGVKVSFTGWCRMALPIAGAALFALACMLGFGLRRPQGWEQLRATLSAERKKLEGWTQGQRNTGLAFLLAVVLWLGAGRWVQEGIAALLAASLLFMLPLNEKRMTLTWQEAVRIDWGTIILFGSGMSLGQLLFDTKLAEAIGTSVVAALHLKGAVSIAMLSAGFALITSELASNTASANVAVPVAMAVSLSAGVSPVVPALAATLCSSFGFLLPVSTPPNALVYGTGKIPLRRMMAYGVMLDAVGFAVISLWAALQR